jgi:hypothetical protein
MNLAHGSFEPMSEAFSSLADVGNDEVDHLATALKAAPAAGLAAREPRSLLTPQ